MGSTLKAFVFMFISILFVSGVQISFVDVESIDTIPSFVEEEQEEDSEEEGNAKSECKITLSEGLRIRTEFLLEQVEFAVPNDAYSAVYLDQIESPPELLT